MHLEGPAWADAGVITQIDISLLVHWDDMLGRCRRCRRRTCPDGAPYFVSEDWGQTSVLFRADLAPEYVAPENQTWGILWDKKYSGRLGAIEAVEDHFNIAAIYLGIDFLDMNRRADRYGGRQAAPADSAAEDGDRPTRPR